MSIAVESAAAGAQVLWGAPTFDQVRIGWDEARRATRGAATFTQQRMTAEFPDGGRIIYRSLDDPDNARGHTADGVVIDEAGDVKELAWYEVLRPILMDTRGWSWVIGTPKGRNWFWREHLAATDRDDSMAWQAPSLGVAIEGGRLVRKPHILENPHLPFAEIEQIWQTSPERVFAQEILAAFVESSGGVFRRVTEAAVLPDNAQPIPGHQYVFGVDWGKSNDFTAIAIWDVTDQALVALDRFNQIDYRVQRQRLGAANERWHPEAILCETNAMGEPIIEQLQQDGLPARGFTTTNATKAAAIEALALAFERGDIRIVADPVLVGELQAYELSRLPSGAIRYSAPEGMHDDTVMAAAIGYHAASVGALTGELFTWA